ncbi:hypothetical protein L5515_007390 [Caenorhabditis briggsae]|uniref:7TM GPCR serpentine receptor class x (Srx) domain-containing protein n=1 Tax=Caenorhabditis briggsae TaxID=6238 RepID=A0AAE9CZU8_CAEBR|nr:hypothetical protein L3Y34_007544 [Caenorhabditis briggsae]UMM34219.1 hypothetical protein L5515_007390 [Caenorhabditis briggsae]
MISEAVIAAIMLISISQTLFVLVTVCSFTWGLRLFPDPDYTFVFSSILWSSVHFFDGFFTIIFNSDIRKKVKPENLSKLFVSVGNKNIG